MPWVVVDIRERWEGTGRQVGEGESSSTHPNGVTVFLPASSPAAAAQAKSKCWKAASLNAACTDQPLHP